MKHLFLDNGPPEAVQDYGPWKKGVKEVTPGQEGRAALLSQEPEREVREWESWRLQGRRRSCEDGELAGAHQRTCEPLPCTGTHSMAWNAARVGQAGAGSWRVPRAHIFSCCFQGFHLSLLFGIVYILNPAHLIHAHGPNSMLVTYKTVI